MYAPFSACLVQAGRGEDGGSGEVVVVGGGEVAVEAVGEVVGEVVGGTDGEADPGALDSPEDNPLAVAFAPPSDREHSAVDTDEGE